MNISTNEYIQSGFSYRSVFIRETAFSSQSTLCISSSNLSTMKYPPIRLGNMPCLVKKSYSCVFIFMSACAVESIKKKIKDLESYLMTGILRKLPSSFADAAFAMSAKEEYILPI